MFKSSATTLFHSIFAACRYAKRGILFDNGVLRSSCTVLERLKIPPSVFLDLVTHEFSFVLKFLLSLPSTEMSNNAAV